MSDWIKSFIVACLVLVALLIIGIAIGVVVFWVTSIHLLIIPIVILCGILAGLTIIVHWKPQEGK